MHTPTLPVPPASPAPPASPGTSAGSFVATVAAVAIVLVGFAAGFLGLRWLASPAHEPVPPRPTPTAVAPVSPAGPGWSLGSTAERRLDAQDFDVEHAQVGEDATELAFFSAHVSVAPKLTVERDTTRPDGTRGDVVQLYLTDAVTLTDVVRRDPMGLAKVGWETDLMPLPGYGYQALSGGVVRFDDGTEVRAERGTSYQLVFGVPAGAREITSVEVTFGWLDQGRTLTYLP